MFRIPGGRDGATRNSLGTPVLLLHGIAHNGAVYINRGPGKSLGSYTLTSLLRLERRCVHSVYSESEMPL